MNDNNIFICTPPINHELTSNVVRKFCRDEEISFVDVIINVASFTNLLMQCLYMFDVDKPFYDLLEKMPNAIKDQYHTVFEINRVIKQANGINQKTPEELDQDPKFEAFHKRVREIMHHLAEIINKRNTIKDIENLSYYASLDCPSTGKTYTIKLQVSDDTETLTPNL